MFIPILTVGYSVLIGGLIYLNNGSDLELYIDNDMIKEALRVL